MVMHSPMLFSRLETVSAAYLGMTENQGFKTPGEGCQCGAKVT